MAKFLVGETIHSFPIYTVRLGQTGAGNQYGDTELLKAVKLTGDSRYELCAVGDAVEGIITSSELALQGTVDGYSIGGIVGKGYKYVTFDGSEAAGTGAAAIGDYVVVGTVTAKGTKLPGPLKVRIATTQAAAKTAPFRARVVSLGSAGTGAVGTVGVIELM